MKKTGKKRQITEMVQIGSAQIPVKVYWELRRDVRYSIGQTGAFLRMPVVLTEADSKKHWDKFLVWLEEAVAKKPKIKLKFTHRRYEDGSILKVGDRAYQIRLSFSQKGNHKAKLIGRTIYLNINSTAKDPDQQQNIRQLISRCVAKDWRPYMIDRVNYWNDRYFNKPINDIKFKMNQSNWGSCSNKQNLNFSTRLLFAPKGVIDYVIVHELAHLVEFNHSKAFWDLVESVIPDYKTKEDWLDEQGVFCRF